MNRQALEHIIRAAADITREKHLIIIGSQAILGQYPDAPEPLLISIDLQFVGHRPLPGHRRLPSNPLHGPQTPVRYTPLSEATLLPCGID